MRGLALLLTGLCGLLGQVRAQGMDVQLAPSAAVDCMAPPRAQRGEPEYPFVPWKRGEGGHVLVELTFNGPDLKPEVKVIQKAGDASLVESVETHVAAYRVPCLQAAEYPVTLRMDFVFGPDNRTVTWSVPVDTADADRGKQLKCMAANDGSMVPPYPGSALRAEQSGNVLALLKFSAPDKPPDVTTYAGSKGMRSLSKAVREWAAKLRAPCLTRPADAVVTFRFRMDGSPPFGFKSIDFLTFLRSVKGLQLQRASFDTNEMGCPFDVTINYRQPHMPNRVGQLGEPDARRQPLLEWLSTLELELRESQVDAVLGDTATFTVPCLKIDLEPKENS